jgi:hypothetical protein
LLKDVVGNRNIKIMIEKEIMKNLEAMAFASGENGWMSHTTFSTIFETYVDRIYFLRRKHINNIIEFYYLLQLLREKDKENQEIDRFIKENKHDAAELYRRQLAKTKNQIRSEMSGIAKLLVKRNQ